MSAEIGRNRDRSCGSAGNHYEFMVNKSMDIRQLSVRDYVKQGLPDHHKTQSHLNYKPDTERAL